MAEKLAAALAELQLNLPHVGKGEKATVKSDKGSYSYTYASLSDISAQVLPLLGKLGLSFIAKPTFTDGRFVLAYSLLHTSGEREDGEYPLPSGTPQQVGSAITYGRRYCLCAVTGIAPDDDDDGAAASHASPESPMSPPPLRAQIWQAWQAAGLPATKEAVEAAYAQFTQGSVLGEASDADLHVFLQAIGDGKFKETTSGDG